MTGTNCDLFTHKSSRSYLNHLVLCLKILFEKKKGISALNISYENKDRQCTYNLHWGAFTKPPLPWKRNELHISMCVCVRVCVCGYVHVCTYLRGYVRASGWV